MQISPVVTSRQELNPNSPMLSSFCCLVGSRRTSSYMYRPEPHTHTHRIEGDDKSWKLTQFKLCSHLGFCLCHSH